MAMSWRVIFFGTAELACAALQALRARPEYELLAVVTQPDKQRGRDLRVRPSAVKQKATALGVKVLQPRRARDEAFIEELRKLSPDLAVVVAYGQILPAALLDVPRYGCVNVHTSILPAHRGAAPIQWALLSGEIETGVTIMKMDEGLDTGPIIAVERTPITPEDNSQTLHDRLAGMGAELLVRTLPGYISGKVIPKLQPEGGNYARKITKEDGQISWESDARKIWNRIRAFTPWPGAYGFLEIGGKPRLLKILEAEPIQTAEQAAPGTITGVGKASFDVRCGEGGLRVKSVQLEGRKKMSAREFLSGHPLQAGGQFAGPESVAKR
jgi:methionyl-tRNA formyltransferase